MKSSFERLINRLKTTKEPVELTAREAHRLAKFIQEKERELLETKIAKALHIREKNACYACCMDLINFCVSNTKVIKRVVYNEANLPAPLVRRRDPRYLALLASVLQE